MDSGLLISEFLPGIWFCKDANSRFLACSKEFSNVLRLKDREDIAGMSDEDLPYSLAESAEEFRKEDLRALSQKKQVALNIRYYTDGKRCVLLTNKTRMDTESSGAIIWCHSIELTQGFLAKVAMSLSHHDACFSDNDRNAFSYTLVDENNKHYLTERELEVLFLFIRGKTAKMSGKILEISSKTVEFHLAKIKKKLHCENRNQLIEKAILENLHTLIPSSLIEKNLID